MKKAVKRSAWAAVLSTVLGLAGLGVCVWQPQFCPLVREARPVLEEGIDRIDEATREAGANADPAALTTDDLAPGP